MEDNKQRFRWGICFLLLVFAFLSACSDETDLPGEQVDPLIEELQAIVDAKVGPDKLVGVSVSIRVGDNRHYKLAGGLSSEGKPITTAMKFGVGSVTKTAVAAATLKLIEQGKLSLQDRIGDHLELSNQNIDPNITVYQLLNHLSGLKGYFHHPDIWPRVEGNLQTAIPTEELMDYVGEPVFSPGDRFEYSNSNYLMLGLLIEKASGMSVGAYLRAEFWSPLQLNNIFFGTHENVGGPIAEAWRDSNGDGVLENITDEFGPAYHSIFYTSADVFADASDLSLWAMKLYRAEALNQDSVDAMLDFLTIDSGSPYWNGYGLGVRRFRITERIMVGHTGGMRGYGSYMLYDQTRDLSIVLLNNQSRSENGPQFRFELVDELLRKVYAAL